MTLHSELKVLSPEQMEQVHNASLKILNETGVSFHSDEALEIFRSNGFRVDGETVFFTEKQIQNALATCPSTYEFHARNPENTVTVGDKSHLIQPVFGCVYVQEPGKPRRKGVYEDFLNYQRLIQGSKVIQLAGGVPIVSSDLNPATRHLYQMYGSIKNTDKPLIGWAASTRQTNEMIDMLEIAYGGKEFIETHQCMGSGINPLSPLAYATETLECVIANAKRNQVLFVNPAAMAGITGPIDLLGTALMQNAEILACIALIQLIRPGVPLVYCPASVVGYMKRASFCTGSPEGMLINIASMQLGRDLYNLPTRTLCGHTDSKVPDYQAGYETMQSIMMAALGGAEILNEALGTLESYMSISFEKFIMDEEIFSRTRRIAEGIDTSNLDASLKLIQEMGQNGSYLTHPSTFKKCRDNWMPSAADWNDYNTWEKEGAKDAAEKAHELLNKRLEAAQAPELDPEIDRELTAYIKAKEASL